MSYANEVQHAALDDAMNAVVLAMLGDHSFEAVRDLLRQAYQRDVAMLQALDAAVFVPEHAVYKRTQAAIDHVLDHGRQLDS